MPRRTVTRCQRRGARGSIALTDEVDLTLGHVFGVDVWEITTAAAMSALWRTWGTEITRRWVEAYPGSRPAALYVLGVIPPCPWQHENPVFRHPFRAMPGSLVRIPDLGGWHNTPRELEHLVAIDVVEEAEHRAAVERWRSRDPRAPGRYRAIAEGAEFGSEVA